MTSERKREGETGMRIENEGADRWIYVCRKIDRYRWIDI